MIKVLCLAFVLMGVVSAERNPRLFFASISSSTSTSTTTSTLSTGSFCYVTATAVNNCKRRKKKALIHSSADDDLFKVSPSKTGSVELAGSPGESPSYRDARLFLLVTSTSTITATQTSTTTAYTATVTL